MLKVDINLLFTVVNVLALCVLVRLFLFKPVKRILAERQERIDRSLAEAEAARTEALAYEEKRRESLRGIEAERLAVLAEAQKKAAEEYEHMVNDAKLRASGIIRTAEAEAAGRRDELLRQAQYEITEIVMAAAAKIAGVGDGGDGVLYDEFIKKAGSSDGENGN